MKAEFYLDEEMIELRRNITCCPRKGELVTFDGENFFEIKEVVNDFFVGRFVLQMEERPDFEYFRKEEIEDDAAEEGAAEGAAEEADIDDGNFEYDDDLDDDYDEE